MSVGLMNLRSLKPVDESAVLGAISNSGLTVTIEDHFITGGLYSIVSELLLSRGTAAKVVPIAFKERWFRPALLPDVLEYEELTGPQIAKRILNELG